VADVLVWAMERRVVLADRAERLRKDLAEIDAEVAGRRPRRWFIEAERSGQVHDRVMAGSWSGSGPVRGRAGCCWSRTASRARTPALPADCRAIWEIVTAASEPMHARDVSVQLARAGRAGP
jgi:hypothetical protein